MPRKNEWTNNRVKVLTELWGEGLSASAISERLMALWPEWTPSRNAVIGKAHRLGLDKRIDPIRVSVQQKERRIKKALETKPSTLEPLFATLVDLPKGACNWPLTGGYCGRKVEEGRQYGWCEHHQKLGNRGKVEVKIKDSKEWRQ